MPATVDVRRFAQIAATAAAALIALSAMRVPSSAGTGHMLVIPASDGYGFDDCLVGEKPCGHVIADAWCEAHGMGAAMSFGRAEDITASILPASKVAATQAKAPAIDRTSVIVNCRD